jgi:hypothetical protein
MQFGRRGAVAVLPHTLTTPRQVVQPITPDSTFRTWLLPLGCALATVTALIFVIVSHAHPALKLVEAPTAFDGLLATSDIRVPLDATVSEVRSAYPDASNLKPVQYNDSMLDIVSNSAGLGFGFYKSDMKLTSIRTLPSFKGQILGMRLGDTRDALLSKLGEPTKEPWDMIGEDSYLYRKSKNWAANFNVTTRDMRDRGGPDEGRIARIFVHK